MLGLIAYLKSHNDFATVREINHTSQSQHCCGNTMDDKVALYREQ